MDGQNASGRNAAQPVSASVPAGTPDAAARLVHDLGPGPFALIILFASLETDLKPLLARMARVQGKTAVVGCTTTGEISETGYDRGRIVALGLPAAGFAAEPLVIEHISRVETRRVVAAVMDARQALARRAESYPHDLAILLIDGVSGQEEALVATLSGGLGQVPMIGGSAGDMTRFRNAKVFANGRIHEDAAVLCLLRCKGPVESFSLVHTRPSAARMIVTAADPAKRAVICINDEPAAREYARLIDVPVDSLSHFTFATRPVLVRAGGRYHARAIRHVCADDSLVFFSAIAQGMVLTVSQSDDITRHLDAELDRLTAGRRPDLILGFDCIFRRIEAEGRQEDAAVSRILARHRVVGFSTFGEQHGALHVNQTLTGVAFYPPERET